MLPFCRPRERRNHDAASLINENVSKRWSVDGQRLFCVAIKIINDSMLRSTKTFESRRRQQQQEWNELTRERRPRRFLGSQNVYTKRMNLASAKLSLASAQVRHGGNAIWSQSGSAVLKSRHVDLNAPNLMLVAAIWLWRNRRKSRCLSCYCKCDSIVASPVPNGERPWLLMRIMAPG